MHDRQRKGKEVKEDVIYIAPLSTHAYSQSAQAWITQFCLQTTPCQHFLRKRSPADDIFKGEAENARHETTGKETTAPNLTKMQGLKLRETETTA